MDVPDPQGWGCPNSLACAVPWHREQRTDIFEGEKKNGKKLKKVVTCKSRRINSIVEQVIPISHNLTSWFNTYSLVNLLCHIVDGCSILEKKTHLEIFLLRMAWLDMHRKTELYFFERVEHSCVFNGDKESNIPFFANKWEISGWQI